MVRMPARDGLTVDLFVAWGLDTEGGRMVDSRLHGDILERHVGSLEKSWRGVGFEVGRDGKE